MIATEWMLAILALLCFPNLLYRATFNIPILLFAAITWEKYNSLAAKLLIISLFIELYQLLDIIITNNKFINPQKNPFLFSMTCIVFVLKIVLIVYLVIKDQKFKRNVSLPSWIQSIGKGLKGEE